MIPENRIPTHPGVILGQEFLAPLGVSQVAFAAHPSEFRCSGSMSSFAARGGSRLRLRGCSLQPLTPRRSSGSTCRLPTIWLGAGPLNRLSDLPR